jgi:hypothetical protein
VNTHRVFFNHLLSKKHVLNELLDRFETQRIVQDIQQKRQQTPGLDMSMRVVSVVEKKEQSIFIY